MHGWGVTFAGGRFGLEADAKGRRKPWGGSVAKWRSIPYGLRLPPLGGEGWGGGNWPWGLKLF